MIRLLEQQITTKHQGIRRMQALFPSDLNREWKGSSCFTKKKKKNKTLIHQFFLGNEAVRGQYEQEEPTGQVKRNFQKTLKCKKVWSVWGTEGREVGPREVFYVVGGRQGPTGSVGPCMLHRKWR